jgi:hypothetical protein
MEDVPKDAFDVDFDCLPDEPEPVVVVEVEPVAEPVES